LLIVDVPKTPPGLVFTEEPEVGKQLPEADGDKARTSASTARASAWVGVVMAGGLRSMGPAHTPGGVCR
jgi:hypothetical protein